MKKERLSWSHSAEGSAARSPEGHLRAGQARPLSPAAAAGANISTRRSDSSSTMIASGCGIKGELFFSGVSQIECRVEGQIAAEGELILGERAQVRADINAQNLVIFGVLEGDIVCSERVELHAGARVRGSICSPRVVMHDGVHFEGDCNMPSSGEQEQELLSNE